MGLMILHPSLITKIMVGITGTLYGSIAGFVIIKGLNREYSKIVKELRETPLKNEVNK
jgi:hypothetical protein